MNDNSDKYLAKNIVSVLDNIGESHYKKTNKTSEQVTRLMQFLNTKYR